MRCHRGFWAYAAEHGEAVKSEKAARFAMEQAAKDEPGVDKAAENWLRSRSGRALRKKWLGESSSERLRYITSNPDNSFPLSDNPTGMADLRRDRTRYPTVMRACVSTPQVLRGEESPAATLATPPLEEQTKSQIKALKGYRGDILRAVTTAQLAALAYAHRQSHVDRVVDISASLVECMGLQMADSIPDTYRPCMLEIMRKVARQLRATKTQLTANLHTDVECQAAISETRDNVNAADNKLQTFVQDCVGVNSTFAAMYSNRDNYRPIETKLLKSFYWLGGANCTESAAVDSSIVDSPMNEPAAAALVDLVTAVSPASDAADSGSAQVNANILACLSTSPSQPSQSRKRQKTLHGIDDEQSVRYQSKDCDSVVYGAASGSCGESSEEYLSDAVGSDDSLNGDTNNATRGRANTHWFFRARVPKNTAIAIWKDSRDPRDPKKARVIHVYQDDLDSLVADGLLTATVLDYFIFRFMPRVDGLICVCGTGIYAEMDTAKYTRNPKKKWRLFNELIEQFDWESYKYVLLPVCGRNHWSFLVIENPIHEAPTKVYHVNSMEKAHNSTYAFDVLHTLLAKVHHSKPRLNSEYEWRTFTHNTRPQQSNGSDCGLYVLYYMTVVSEAIAKEKPVSIEEMMEKWTSGGFNVTKAAAYRSQLYNRISSA